MCKEKIEKLEEENLLLEVENRFLKSLIEEMKTIIAAIDQRSDEWQKNKSGNR